jgi:glutamate-1-semialdehyde 2,1-aminomutase
MGELLMEGISALAQCHGIALRVTGFGAAFYLHFTTLPELRDYRDTLSDNYALLQRFLHAALSEGVILVPDGRLYVSAAHTEHDISETLARLDRAFAKVA